MYINDSFSFKMFVQHTRESYSYYCFQALHTGTDHWHEQMPSRICPSRTVVICNWFVKEIWIATTHFPVQKKMFFQHTLQTRSSIAFRIAYRTRSITAFRYRIPALHEQMLSRTSMSYSSRSKLKLVDLLSWYSVVVVWFLSGIGLHGQKYYNTFPTPINFKSNRF